MERIWVGARRWSREELLKARPLLRFLLKKKALPPKAEGQIMWYVRKLYR